MDFFRPIEGGNVLLVNNGTYTEALLHERAGKVFAKMGSGYIKLWPSHSTSKARVFWHELDCDTGTIEIQGPDLVYVPTPTTKSRGGRKIAAVG